jgi:hypothetical protein
MAGLVPAIHVIVPGMGKFVDARHKAGHDEWNRVGTRITRAELSRSYRERFSTEAPA